DVDVAPGVQTNGHVVVQEAGVGALSDRADDRVRLDREVAALDGDGPAATGAVGLAELHLQAVQGLGVRGGRVTAVRAQGDAGRGGEEHHLHALLEGLGDLERLRWHLVAGAPVDEGHVAGALTQRGPHAVDRGVSATDDDGAAEGDLLALGDLFEVVDPEPDTLGALSVDVQRLYAPRADREIDGGEVAAPVLDRLLGSQPYDVYDS